MLHSASPFSDKSSLTPNTTKETESLREFITDAWCKWNSVLPERPATPALANTVHLHVYYSEWHNWGYAEQGDFLRWFYPASIGE